MPTRVSRAARNRLRTLTLLIPALRLQLYRGVHTGDSSQTMRQSPSGPGTSSLRKAEPLSLLRRAGGPCSAKSVANTRAVLGASRGTILERTPFRAWRTTVESARTGRSPVALPGGRRSTCVAPQQTGSRSRAKPLGRPLLPQIRGLAIFPGRNSRSVESAWVRIVAPPDFPSRDPTIKAGPAGANEGWIRLPWGE